MNSVLIYLVVISVFSVIITVYDKLAAKYMRQKRVPERLLFLTALLCGSVSMYITMQIIRHKTRHKRFMVGLPIIIIVQGLIFYFVFAK